MPEGRTGRLARKQEEGRHTEALCLPLWRQRGVEGGGSVLREFESVNSSKWAPGQQIMKREMLCTCYYSSSSLQSEGGGRKEEKEKGGEGMKGRGRGNEGEEQKRKEEKGKGRK